VKYISFVFLVLAFAAAAGADPIGLTVGFEFGAGNVIGDDYRFAGKADPASGRQAGQSNIMPYVNYNKTINNFLFNAYLCENMYLDNPQTAQLKCMLTGAYNFLLNGGTSILTVSLDSVFKLNTYGWKTRVSDGAGSWEEIVIPAVQFTRVLKFGSIYGKYSSPIYVADLEKAPTPDYERPFFFSDVQAGLNTPFGLGVWLRSLFQLSPTGSTAPLSAYDTYGADTAFQQLDFGISYTDQDLFTSLTFSFPIPGDKIYPNGVKDVGFKMVPLVSYRINSQMQALLRFEIRNIGKDTPDFMNDKIVIIPTAGFSYSF
jgi:hypothetical protein